MKNKSDLEVPNVNPSNTKPFKTRIPGWGTQQGAGIDWDWPGRCLGSGGKSSRAAEKRGEHGEVAGMDSWVWIKTMKKSYS